MAGKDKEQIGKPVQVDSGPLTDILTPRESHHGPFGPSADRTSKVQPGRRGGAPGQDESIERLQGFFKFVNDTLEGMGILGGESPHVLPDRSWSRQIGT